MINFMIDVSVAVGSDLEARVATVPLQDGRTFFSLRFEKVGISPFSVILPGFDDDAIRSTGCACADRCSVAAGTGIARAQGTCGIERGDPGRFQFVRGKMGVQGACCLAIALLPNPGSPLLA